MEYLLLNSGYRFHVKLQYRRPNKEFEDKGNYKVRKANLEIELMKCTPKKIILRAYEIIFIGEKHNDSK